jgi:uncharacterized membrane protein YjjP (DUF1212 family)
VDDGDPRAIDTGLILALGRALHELGASAPRVEQAMELLARRAGLEGQFFATPTSIFAAFGVPGDQRTSLLRVQPSGVHLAKRVDVETLLRDVLAGRIGAQAARARLAEILAAPDPYGVAVTIACFGLASAASCRFFGGGWNELAPSLGAGLLVGALAHATGRWRGAGRVLEALAAFSVAAATMLVAHRVRPLETYTVIVSGLIVLLPGFTLTSAMSELSLGHLASGTARLMGSLLVFLQLLFGVALGRRAIELLAPLEPSGGGPGLPGWTLVAALVLAPLCFTVLLRARFSDAGWILASGSVAFLGARWGAELLGPELGAFLGALAVAAGSNVYARALHRPSAVPMVPGILMLVPGSIGFRSLSSFLERDVLGGVETAFRVGLVAIAIVAGLLVANVLVHPRSLERER